MDDDFLFQPPPSHLEEEREEEINLLEDSFDAETSSDDGREVQQEKEAAERGTVTGAEREGETEGTSTDLWTPVLALFPEHASKKRPIGLRYDSRKKWLQIFRPRLRIASLCTAISLSETVSIGKNLLEDIPATKELVVKAMERHDLMCLEAIEKTSGMFSDLRGNLNYERNFYESAKVKAALDAFKAKDEARQAQQRRNEVEAIGSRQIPSSPSTSQDDDRPIRLLTKRPPAPTEEPKEANPPTTDKGFQEKGAPQQAGGPDLPPRPPPEAPRTNFTVTLRRNSRNITFDPTKLPKEMNKCFHIGVIWVKGGGHQFGIDRRLDSLGIKHRISSNATTRKVPNPKDFVSVCVEHDLWMLRDLTNAPFNLTAQQVRDLKLNVDLGVHQDAKVLELLAGTKRRSDEEIFGRMNKTWLWDRPTADASSSDSEGASEDSDDDDDDDGSESYSEWDSDASSDDEDYRPPDHKKANAGPPAKKPRTQDPRESKGVTEVLSPLAGTKSAKPVIKGAAKSLPATVALAPKSATMNKGKTAGKRPSDGVLPPSGTAGKSRGGGGGGGGEAQRGVGQRKPPPPQEAIAANEDDGIFVIRSDGEPSEEAKVVAKGAGGRPPVAVAPTRGDNNKRARREGEETRAGTDRGAGNAEAAGPSTKQRGNTGLGNGLPSAVPTTAPVSSTTPRPEGPAPPTRTSEGATTAPLAPIGLTRVTSLPLSAAVPGSGGAGGAARPPHGPLARTATGPAGLSLPPTQVPTVPWAATGLDALSYMQVADPQQRAAHRGECTKFLLGVLKVAVNGLTRESCPPEFDFELLKREIGELRRDLLLSSRNVEASVDLFEDLVEGVGYVVEGFGAPSDADLSGAFSGERDLQRIRTELVQVIGNVLSIYGRQLKA